MGHAGNHGRIVALHHLENQARLRKPDKFAGRQRSTAYHGHGNQFTHPLLRGFPSSACNPLPMNARRFWHAPCKSLSSGSEKPAVRLLNCVHG